MLKRSNYLKNVKFIMSNKTLIFKIYFSDKLDFISYTLNGVIFLYS